MVRLCVCTLLATFVLATAAPSVVLAQKKKVEIIQKFNGSVDDEKALKPDAITSAKALATVWTAWKVKGDVPKVDFDKNIIVAVYSVGSRVNLAGASLDDAGNLSIISLGTSDFGPGFRYVLGVVNREGIKTVNKKELPKD